MMSSMMTLILNIKDTFTLMTFQDFIGKTRNDKLSKPCLGRRLNIKQLIKIKVGADIICLIGGRTRFLKII